MLDDLREQASDSDYFDAGEETFDFEETAPTYVRKKQLLGMTAPQRFVIAVMLLVVVCILSSFCLLVTEKMVLPTF